MTNHTPTLGRRFIQSIGGLVLSVLMFTRATAGDTEAYDVCVYTANASGVMAAVAAAREGSKVIVVEPSRWLGGMTGGGLIHIDWGREEAVGGSARAILKSNDDDPKFRATFEKMLKDHSIPVVFDHRVASVKRDGSTLRSILLDYAPFDLFGCPIAKPVSAAARTIQAKVFIDCSYEGDLMARAGVAYSFGRESRETYGESLAGTQVNMAVYDIDPYLTPGDPSSGLIPLIQSTPLKPEGSADSLTMGYGFRWKLTWEADGLPIQAPEDYDPKVFELYRRGFKKGIDMFTGRRMKHRLDNWEVAKGYMFTIGVGNLSRALWAPTNYGSNADYPDGDYATRARIWKAQQNFFRGITHFLRTDPAVPQDLKEQALKIGLQPGIFNDSEGYPHQLYVREARRMKSAYVITQKDVSGQTDPEDSVGLASYGVDEWPYATIPIDGKVALQGGYLSEVYLEESHRGIYKIPYRAITPKQEECTNLLVPVCVSASHIAMTSIRMEPVWMILGESAGTAAAMAVANHVAVQEVDYLELRKKLLNLSQRLERP